MCYTLGVKLGTIDTVYNTNTAQLQEPVSCTVPDGSWQKVGTDYFDFDGTKYLLLIDYFKKFIYVEEMCTTTAKSTIKKLKTIFSIEGSPNISSLTIALFLKKVIKNVWVTIF